MFLHGWHNRAVPFQDVAETSLKPSDEGSEEENAELESLTEKFKPLLTWLKKEAGELVRDAKGPISPYRHAFNSFRPLVVISNRLVLSSCAIVADVHGYTANVEKLMSKSVVVFSAHVPCPHFFPIRFELRSKEGFHLRVYQETSLGD